jgi:uncharacterized protein (DUF433 family)
MGMAEKIVVRSSEVLGGTPVFRGTRVPFRTMMEYLEAGDSIDDFLQDFPTVSRADVIAALEQAKSLVIERVA